MVSPQTIENIKPPDLTDDLGAYLHSMVELQGSDLFLTTGALTVYN